MKQSIEEAAKEYAECKTTHLNCSLDEQQCRDSCEHKADRAKCPFTSFKHTASKIDKQKYEDFKAGAEWHAQQLNPVAPIQDNKQERIICAANYYQDWLIHEHQPKNVSNGFVVCGRRHHNCINTFASIVGFPYSDRAKEIHQTEVQGFLTNTNRFVDRKEAYKIAFAANQIIGPNKGCSENSIGLTSEDLY